MTFSEFCLKRPVLTVVLSIIILVFGYVGYTFLSLREFPAIDPPVVTVSTNYTGANADIVESQITEPLEKVINGIQGIRTISSSSSNGNSNITVEFNLDVNLDDAANDVRDKVGQAARQLPQDLDAPPVVTKADASSDPIIILAMQSRDKNLLELSDYAANDIAEKLQTIPEVSSVRVFGERRYAMRIWIKPDQLNATGLTFGDITAALNRENVELPSGKIYGNNTELTIRSLGRLTTEQEFRDMIIRQNADGIVRLSDVADVVLGPDIEETAFRLDGSSNLGIGIIPQPGSNYLKISDEFYKRLDQIKADADEGTEFYIVFDSTLNIRNSLKEVEETLIIALLLVVIVVYVFFRNWSMAFRPLIDIPVSLIGSFFIMYVMGFSINVLTLLAIVLATGLVVDDGIVVTENIFRKMERGLNVRRAAKEGTDEIIFAVISTSITLAIVFLPVIFLQGFVGSLFREFGVVVAGAVLISAFVSLTLTPVLSVWLTGKRTGHSKFYKMTEPFFRGMEEGYHRLLTRLMRFRWVALLIIAGSGVVIVLVGGSLPSELAPLEDRGSIRFSFTAPEGTAFDFMDRFVDDVALYVRDSLPEREHVFGSANPPFNGSGATNSGFGRVTLGPKDKRKRSQDEITIDLNKKLQRFNNGRIFLIQEQTISVGLGSRNALPVQFVIQHQNFEKIKEALPKFLAEARNNPVFQMVDANLKFNKPELQLSYDRIRAQDLGLSVAAINEALQAALAGRRAGYFNMNGRQYQVIAQVDRASRDEPADLDRLFVRNANGQLIPLSSVVNLEENSNPPQLFHYNRYKSVTVSASLAPGKTVGDGVGVMREIADKVLDDSFQTSLTGPSRDFAESSSNTMFAFLLALGLIYLVLAAQFESFLDPVTIMITVPLALAGALLSLWLTGNTLNIFSQIGMIMLIGLVAKNGILIVEFANQKIEDGMARWDAVIEAASQRLRPILMTSLATALGALPIALSIGGAATSRIPLGIVIVGGIFFSLLLTLFVIPAMFTYIVTRRKSHAHHVENNARPLDAGSPEL